MEKRKSRSNGNYLGATPPITIKNNDLSRKKKKKMPARRGEYDLCLHEQLICSSFCAVFCDVWKFSGVKIWGRASVEGTVCK